MLIMLEENFRKMSVVKENTVMYFHTVLNVLSPSQLPVQKPSVSLASQYSVGDLKPNFYNAISSHAPDTNPLL